MAFSSETERYSQGRGTMTNNYECVVCGLFFRGLEDHQLISEKKREILCLFCEEAQRAEEENQPPFSALN